MKNINESQNYQRNASAITIQKQQSFNINIAIGGQVLLLCYVPQSLHTL